MSNEQRILNQNITFRFDRKFLVFKTGVEFDHQGHYSNYSMTELATVGNGDVNAGISAIVIALSEQEVLVGQTRPFHVLLSEFLK